MNRRLPPLVAGLLTLVCFVLAYLALTSQTPYCYTLREFRDGRMEYREFQSSADATRYEQQHGFWSQGSGVREESGCSSDKVYPREGALAASLALLGLSAPLATARQPGARGVIDVMGKTLLGLLTVGSLVSLMSIGAVVAPLLLPFHWVAARRAGSWTRGVWLFFAGVCSWILGLWIVHALSSEGSAAELLIPLTISGVTSVTFAATSTRARNGSSPT